MIYGNVEENPDFTSNEGEWFSFIPGEKVTLVPDRRLGEPHGLDVMVKRRLPASATNQTPAVQPVPSHLCIIIHTEVSHNMNSTLEGK